MIHSSAIVDRGASVDPTAEIGPYAIVEAGSKIGAGVKVWPHAYISAGTDIGEGTQVHMGAVIGHVPQDLAFEGKPSYTVIGKRNVIREYATIHRGTREGSATMIGDDNYFMAVSHVGHNCEIGDRVIVSNGALLAGYVKVEDNAFISGNVVIHQFCRIGTLAMIGGFSGVNKDVPPYMLVRGPSKIRAINLVGMRRQKLAPERIRAVREAFRILYKSGLNMSQAMERLRGQPGTEEIGRLIDFIEASKRGVCFYGDDESEFHE